MKHLVHLIGYLIEPVVHAAKQLLFTKFNEIDFFRKSPCEKPEQMN